MLTINEALGSIPGATHTSRAEIVKNGFVLFLKKDTCSIQHYSVLEANLGYVVRSSLKKKKKGKEGGKKGGKKTLISIMRLLDNIQKE